MNNAKPQMGPNSNQGFSQGNSGGSPSTPSAIPPTGAGMSAKSGNCGCHETAAGSESPPSAFMAISGSGDSAPTVHPATSVGAGVTAWQNNQKISGLWGINQNRNSWVYVAGMGWKKLANNSDSAVVALTVLSSHAREKNSPVNFREESDGMVHEFYVW